MDLQKLGNFVSQPQKVFFELTFFYLLRPFFVKSLCLFIENMQVSPFIC